MQYNTEILCEYYKETENYCLWGGTKDELP